MDTLNRSRRLASLTALLVLLALTSGCEDDDDSIVDYLLERDVSEDDSTDDDFDTDSELRPDRLPDFDSQYEGETGAASIDADEDDAERMADTAFLVWHMVRIQQGIDAMIEIRTEEDNTTLTGDWAWEDGFNGVNCGDSSDISFDGSGSSGEGSLADACIENVDRTDGTPFRVDGDFEWEDARSDDGTTGEDSTRKVSFDSLTVTWRDEDYELKGATEVEEGSTTVALALEVEDEEREQMYRYLAELQFPYTAGSDNDEFLFHPDLGGVRQARASTPAWVQGNDLDCDSPEQAATGRIQITEPDEDTDFRVDLAACDQYNLDGVDADSNSLPSEPFTLFDAL